MKHLGDITQIRVSGIDAVSEKKSYSTYAEVPAVGRGRMWRVVTTLET